MEGGDIRFGLGEVGGAVDFDLGVVGGPGGVAIGSDTTRFGLGMLGGAVGGFDTRLGLGPVGGVVGGSDTTRLGLGPVGRVVGGVVGGTCALCTPFQLALGSLILLEALIEVFRELCNDCVEDLSFSSVTLRDFFSQTGDVGTLLAPPVCRVSSELDLEAGRRDCEFLGVFL